MLSLQLFGGAVLEDEAGSVSGSATRRHPMALLGLLATAPSHTLSRGKLVGYLWPEAPEKKARNRLNTCVHQLRSEAGEDVLVSVGDDLRLNTDAVSCDVCRFEAAIESSDHATAVELYLGPFMDGFQLDGSAAFEKWLDRTRDRLRRDHLDALEALAVAHEERGEPEAAARRWRERAEEDPYDSRVTKRLMEALAEAGNRAAALRVARRHARRLEEEFGTEPDAGIRRLAARLKEAPGEPPRARSASEEESRPERAPATPGEASPPAQAPSDSSEGLKADGATPSSDASTRPDHRATSRLALGSLVAIGLLVAAAVGAWYLVGGGGETSERGDRSVAVLPFESGDASSSSLLTEGLHGAVLAKLSTLSDLTVVSPTTGRELASAQGPVAEAARELGVSWLVGGSVVEEGDEVRVNARLVDTRTGESVWTEGYRRERTAGGLFEIQTDITREIVTALQAELTPEEERRLQELPTDNIAAYELYLQARELERSEGPATESRVDRFVDLHRRALELDPEFAEAWAGLADALVGRAWMRGEPAWADSGAAAAARALELDPDLAIAHAQLGDARWAQGRSPDVVVETYQRALELRPNVPEAGNNLLVFLATTGRIADKVRTLEILRRTSPGASRLVASLATTNALLGRDSLARSWLALGRDRGHDLTETELWLTLFYRGETGRAGEILQKFAANSQEEDLVSRYRGALALYEGNWTEARRHYRSLYIGRVRPAGAPLFSGLLYDGLGLAWALDRLDSRQEAREIATEVVEGVREHLATSDSWNAPRHRMAVAELVLGDTAAALAWLERSVDAGYRGAPTLRSIPVLEPLRDHPRFEALLARVDSLVAEELRIVEENGWGVPPRTGS